MNAVANLSVPSLPDLTMRVGEREANTSMSALDMAITATRITQALPHSPAPPVLLSPPPATHPVIWRPGVDVENDKMKAVSQDSDSRPMEVEDEDEDDEEDEDEFEDDPESNAEENQEVDGSCDSSSASPQKTGLSNRKGSREQTKIQPLRLESGLEAFRCPICFPDGHPGPYNPIAGRKALTEHLRWHQNQEQQQEGRFACCYCSKELSSYSSLDRHLLTHTNFRPFVCNHCNRDFTTNGNLNRHVKTSHQAVRNGSSMPSLNEDVPPVIRNGAVPPIDNKGSPLVIPPSNKSVRQPLSAAHNPTKSVPPVITPATNPPMTTTPQFNPHPTFPIGTSQSMPSMTDGSFVTTCLSMSMPTTAAANLLPSTAPTFPAFDPSAAPFAGYNAATWLSMFMRPQYPGSTPPVIPFPQIGPAGHPLIPPSALLQHGIIGSSEDSKLSGPRPMPVLTPQNSVSANESTAELPALTIEEIKDEEGKSKNTQKRAESSNHSSTSAVLSIRSNPIGKASARSADYRKLKTNGGITRMRLADRKKLIYKAGLQHWGRVLRSKAIDFLNSRQKVKTLRKNSLIPVPPPVKEFVNGSLNGSQFGREDVCLPLDLSMKTGISTYEDCHSPTQERAREFERQAIMASLPSLHPMTGTTDDSVLDLSVRSSSLSDGASPPASRIPVAPCPPGLGIQDMFVPPILTPTPHMVLHMQCDDVLPKSSMQLLESNNNYSCDNSADTQLPIIETKKKVNEPPQIFTGRYAKRRPQKKTNLAPPTLNPYLKLSSGTLDNSIDVSMDSSTDHIITSPDSTQIDRNGKNQTNRKKNSYKDAPNRMLCPIEGCEQQFPWKSSLKRHVITHYDFKPYKCVTCGRHFSTKSNRERHIERLHGNKSKRGGRQPKMVNEKTDCREAFDLSIGNDDLESMNFSDLKADRMSEEILEKAGHIVTAPNPERIGGTFAGTRPGRHSMSQESLSPVLTRPNSLDANDLPSMATSRSNALTCDHCKVEICGGPQGMQAHIRTHHQSVSTPTSAQSFIDGGAFRCPVCAREFALQDAALDHMQTAHPSEWEMTTSKLKVDKLIRGLPLGSSGWSDGYASGGDDVEGQKRILCPVCRRKFASFQDLQRHARSHTGERPFICSVCHREFALKHSLNRHMRTHEPSALMCGTNISGSGEEL